LCPQGLEIGQDAKRPEARDIGRIRREAFDPAHDRSVRQRQPALGHYFNEVSKAGLVTQISTHTQDDDFAVKVAAVEQPVDVYQLTHSLLALVKTRA
jgi:hypothetical protein